ncbi:creatininase family protein [Actinomadura citrea]|uniref:Creatinine amidohydrolase n=1 Tax=Actinomadura citrea TaxID=46158 RepID=A0A7Y9KHJ5_9ACTN|nr:creatininase family protein [Actinomadura citrea]NYE17631.1 creatinine amidohydrolase [Actinomadura citrea]GGT60666.1 creatininase [Actinomadura citrea]
MDDGTRDVFAGTLAELTWHEVDAAARSGAVLLWAFGVIEQHGPHLPTGTDVYLPVARLRAVRTLLAERGVQALIVPPYYWGVNVVSGAFPASYDVRPELMREIMVDLLAGMARDGFRHVFCFSGHGDALHNRTVHDGVRAACERTDADASFVTEPALARRIGLEADDPYLTLYGPDEAPPDGPVDVHAGSWETSLMMHTHPRLVREEVRARLEPSGVGPSELAIWRQGYEHARRVTPDGYLGDPAAADAAEGLRIQTAAAEQAAAAIVLRLRDDTRRPRQNASAHPQTERRNHG